MNLHEGNMSKFMPLIDLKYTMSLFLNIFLDSGYTIQKKNPLFFSKDLGEVEVREMIILWLMIEIFTDALTTLMFKSQNLTN